MGIYETLYAFLASFGTYMGEPGTHPWSQGFPRTVQLPGGPEIPTSVTVTPDDLKYPKAWGMPALREAIAGYYRGNYGAEITAENVMVFAGGRPGIIAVLLFLESDITIRIASTEYTPYYDMLRLLGRPYTLVESGAENRFFPTADARTRRKTPPRKTVPRVPATADASSSSAIPAIPPASRGTARRSRPSWGRPALPTRVC